MRDLNFSRVEALLYDYRTYAQAIRNLTNDLDRTTDHLSISNYQKTIEIKKRNKEKVEEIVQLFDLDEMIIWKERYLEGKKPDYIYDTHGWSKSTYHRIRNRLVIKAMKCLGYL